MELKYRVINKVNMLLMDKPFGIFLVLFIPVFTFIVVVFRGDLRNSFITAYDSVLARRNASNNERVAGADDIAEATQTPSTFKELLDPVFTEPNALEIESINLYANIINVGVGEDGSLETPKDWNTLGWFIRSAKPGQEGNAVINGHYDNNWGGPAAFWKLRNAKVGDIVTVSDAYNRSYDYSVTKTFHVEIDDPNRLEVLESVEGKSTLTLITCDGFYVPQNGTYNKRLVVQADLVQ